MGQPCPGWDHIISHKPASSVDFLGSTVKCNYSGEWRSVSDPANCRIPSHSWWFPDRLCCAENLKPNVLTQRRCGVVPPTSSASLPCSCLALSRPLFRWREQHRPKGRRSVRHSMHAPIDPTCRKIRSKNPPCPIFRQDPHPTPLSGERVEERLRPAAQRTEPHDRSAGPWTLILRSTMPAGRMRPWPQALGPLRPLTWQSRLHPRP